MGEWNERRFLPSRIGVIASKPLCFYARTLARGVGETNTSKYPHMFIRGALDARRATVADIWRTCQRPDLSGAAGAQPDHLR